MGTPLVFTSGLGLTEYDAAPKMMVRNGSGTWRKSPNTVLSQEFKEGGRRGYSAAPWCPESRVPGAGKTVHVCWVNKWTILWEMTRKDWLPIPRFLHSQHFSHSEPVLFFFWPSQVSASPAPGMPAACVGSSSVLLHNLELHTTPYTGPSECLLNEWMNHSISPGVTDGWCFGHFYCFHYFLDHL